ncbi:MAG: C1 family peptidase [Nitrospirales bacterium]|nr:alpha/beta hydrolase [Nitrospira sp.]MDR4500686.1 C1 family peptidase [Nitrospirales bacterium]
MADYKRVKNVEPDVPDIRDWPYQPALIPLTDAIDPPGNLQILDQKSEGACTGFALAAAINLLNSHVNRHVRVSPRMLYEMAKRHDEWPGEKYDGSSLRGAIHGWKHMGVCSEDLWPYRVGKKNIGDLTIECAKDARKTTVGAYYRVQPSISHFHAALNETGVIVVSAKVHRGWDAPQNGIITFEEQRDGGHAFVIVGYNDKGFWVQNSWGPKWGNHGLALWTYEDWIVNVMDAWVFRLALSTPQIFDLKPEMALTASPQQDKAEASPTPRSSIAGHFVHVDDGRYATSGPYWSTPEDVEQTAELVANSSKYQHLLFYMHGGLNSPKASAKRIEALKERLKSNGIYPFHIMYDTGVVEELKDLIFRKENEASERVGGFSDWTDRFIEGVIRRPGTLLWEEMKQDAHDAFAPDGAGTDAVNRFTKHIKKSNKTKKIHLVGHSTGAIVIAHLLHTLRRYKFKIETCTLLAPACSVDLYHSHYLPVLQGKTILKINDLTIYNLRDELEQDDHVAKIYRKSLLYLVSNALERRPDPPSDDSQSKPLLGMEIFATLVKTVRSKPQFIYSNGVEGKRTRSTTHGGFDNDIFTMNHVLERVLGKKPADPFTEDDLDY